ncbi:hypothetical protein ACH5RR_040747 [Cinchona calisaya]|uniref:Uncharacterized protein n=1 Tax=Cinchona calisaya TaxID=153742 RepID=A0ABD2XVM9_9GENT
MVKTSALLKLLQSRLGSAYISAKLSTEFELEIDLLLGLASGVASRAMVDSGWEGKLLVVLRQWGGVVYLMVTLGILSWDRKPLLLVDRNLANSTRMREILWQLVLVNPHDADDLQARMNSLTDKEMEVVKLFTDGIGRGTKMLKTTWITLRCSLAYSKGKSSLRKQ